MFRIKQLLPVSGNWKRVLGTKKAPRFEPILFWAVIESDEQNDIIVGVPRSDIGVSDAVESWWDGVAGYVEMTSTETEFFEEFPDGLERYDLIWEGE